MNNKVLIIISVHLFLEPTNSEQWR